MMADHSERPAAGSNLVRLEAIAVEAKLIRCSIRADVPDGYVQLSFVAHGQAERIQVGAGCAFHYGPGYAGPIPAVSVNPDRSMSFIRQSNSESYSWPEKSIGDALRSLVSDWKHATPDFDSIKIETKKSPVKGAELGQLLLAVWMEAFGQEAPSLEGLQRSVKRARSKKKDLRQQCLEWLHSGAVGVKRWNELRDDDRTGIGKLGQCQFANCDLREVLFHNQDLRGSDFQQANLQAARMGGADCREAMFRGADLTGAFLSGGKFVQADFTDACCCNTAMRSADCRAANFSGTNLSSADFGFADLRQVDLSTANLAEADLFRAKYDEQTRFPADFNLKSEWMLEWKGAVPREPGYTKHCSLEELLALIPAPATPCDTTGDWDEAATAIGTPFPSDFQSLIGKYGSGTILGDVEIYNPMIAEDRKRIASDLDTLTQMREACEYLWQIHPEESGILPWGTDSNGNIFCWLTVGAPDEWPTAVLGHGEDEPSSDAVNITTFLYNFARNIYPEMQGGQTFSESDHKFESKSELQAEYLRLQAELVSGWTFTNPMFDVVARMATLRPKLNLDWLATVRTCTTPPSPVDMAALLPEIRGLTKTTVRLNPRPGSAGPADSKIGGLFLWPQNQEWPHCDEHDSAYVAALQIRNADFPEVVFREGTDLMQVLWCPNDHEPDFCPAVRVFWRKRADVTKPVNEHSIPKPEEYSNYVPRQCRLYPERIVEYPDPFEGLPEGVRDQLESLPQVAAALESNRALVTGNWSDHGEADRLYQCALSTAEGTKLGGYPDWVQDPWYPKCQCGAPMEHLVSFSSWEFDGETWFRWLPVEERDVLTAENKIRSGVQAAANWMFGDAGNMYVFICRQCPDWPVVAGMQCS